MAYEVDELTSAVYTATLKDESGATVPGSVLESLTLTLYDAASSSVLNSRNAQDALNNNDVTVDESGLLTWTIQIEDNPILNDTPTTLVKNSAGDRVEVHKALFRAVWDNGNKAVNHLITLNVKAYDKLA